MPTRAIKILKPFVFLLGLVPLYGMVWSYRTNNLGADPVQSIQHWTGDWTIWMLIASLAITPIRRVLPKLGWLIRFRRMIGLFAFFYATLHLLTYLLLGSGLDLRAVLDALSHGDVSTVRQQWAEVWPTTYEDISKHAFIQLGLLAYTILLALAVTSPQWIMRKMGGRPWRTLHRTAYAAAVLGAIHYWLMVKKGVLTPWKDTAVIAVLLLARILWTRRQRGIGN